MILRALGPSLTPSGVVGAITDPMLEVYDSTGALIASNDNWRDGQEALFAAAGPYEAFQPGSDLEAAIGITLPAGTYWAVVEGKNNTRGVAVAELEDFSQDADTELVNVAGRGMVQTGDNVLVGGLTVDGDTDASLILRALGSSLNPSRAENVLSDPILELYDSNGSLVSLNDNWNDDPAQATQISAKGLAPTGSAEAAMAVSLSPGDYTAVIRGKNGTTGVSSFEVYKLP